ncbi:MAG: DUF4062 domain-containing protein [Acidobacteriia bacterium]|nr:DUF4062 domain-containing protein [Terriglobia bacterium]
MVVAFHAWHSDPVRELVGMVCTLVGATRSSSVSSTQDLRLACQKATEDFDGSLLLILDQFEEYFQYHPGEDGEGTFAVEFPRIVKSDDLRVNVLVSIREDCLAILDRFKGRIPNLFDNYLRIRNLDRDSAREAILRPIDQFNSEHRGNAEKVTIQPALADRLIDDLLKGKTGEERVEAPYLQLVMSRWWDREMEKHSLQLRYETLYELGGVNHIYHQHLSSTMSELTLAQRDAAAKIFKLMVTPSGRKQAQTVFDLTNSTDLKQDVVVSILEPLRRARIVNPVALPRTSAQNERCYEFAHDVVAKAALEWQQEYEQKLRSPASVASSRGRRYQVFISSTFDLKEERQAAIEAVLERGHIPISLEMFSPSSESGLHVVETAMRDSQVFLQILGHRYGSLVPGEGISYTELEYDIAQKLGLIILTFVLRSDQIAERRQRLDPNSFADRTELQNFDKLERFHRRASQDFQCVWEKGRAFKYLVELALADNLARADKPGLITEPYDMGIIEAAQHNEFVVDIVKELQGFEQLHARCAEYPDQKRALARFFAQQYMDRIRRHQVSLFFESGSTVAYVAKEMSRFLAREVKLDSSGSPNILVCTNSVLAYLMLWLVARVPCYNFPAGPVGEDTYGASYGRLEHELARPPEYSGNPLDEAAKWEIQALLEQPFSLTSMNRPALLLGSLSGLKLEEPVLKFPDGLPKSARNELSGLLRQCFGPHVGSYRNKVFKRFLYATRLPIVIFLTANKIDARIEVGGTYFVHDSEFTWEEFYRNYPIAFCVGCTVDERPKNIEKFKRLGFRVLEAHTYSAMTSFIARNQRFIEEFEAATSVEGSDG